jgi:hypothetical protein
VNEDLRKRGNIRWKLECLAVCAILAPDGLGLHVRNVATQLFLREESHVISFPRGGHGLFPLFCPAGGSVWRRDFRPRKVQSSKSVTVRIGGSQYAILQKISLAFGGRIRTGIGSPTCTPTCLSRKNSSLCGLLAQMPATIAKTVMQTSSVASENCSFMAALYPTGGLSCQTGVCVGHLGAPGIRGVRK